MPPRGWCARDWKQGRPLLAQGITTIVGNPDGGGPIDLDAQRTALETRGLGPNVALLIGHGSVRGAVLGQAARAPDAAELVAHGGARRPRDAGRRVRALERAVLRAGQLREAPTRSSRSRSAWRRSAGVYTSHIRDEGNYDVGLLASVDEVIRIAEEAGVIGIVSHMKALGPDNWGKAVEAADRIERARARGVRVFADQYPYDASSTSLAAAVIPRLGAGWRLTRAGRPGRRPGDAAEASRRDAREHLRGGAAPASLQVAHYAPDRVARGQDARRRSRRRAVSTPRTRRSTLAAKGSVSIVSFNMADRDIARHHEAARGR